MRVTDIRDLDGLSITDAKRIPHPADLARWEGLYRINAERSVFELTQAGFNSLFCTTCERPARRFCAGVGELEYPDGSSRVCPNWNMKLDEIGGMTREEADAEDRRRRMFR